MTPTLKIDNLVCTNGRLGTVVRPIDKGDNKQHFEVRLLEDFSLVECLGSELIPDLFEHHESIPQEVQEVLNRFSQKVEDGMDYQDCALLVTQLEVVGYTCEYYLDAELFFLRKKEVVLED